MSVSLDSESDMVFAIVEQIDNKMNSLDCRIQYSKKLAELKVVAVKAWSSPTGKEFSLTLTETEFYAES